MRLERQNIPFTMVANEVLASPELSLSAKGLYAYLFSKPEGWQFSSNRIIKECQESKPTILKLLRELEEHCLLQRRRQKSGRVQYLLTFSTCVVDPGQQVLPGPESKEALVKNSPHAQVLPVSNTEKESNTDNTKTDLVAETIDLFKEINPAYHLYFARPPQRKAAQRLLNDHGFDAIKKILEYVKQHRDEGYFPTIKSPCDLEEKWISVRSFYKKHSAKKSSVAFA